MLRQLNTLCFWRQALWCVAMAGFLAAALQVAVPLHAQACRSQCHCPDASEISQAPDLPQHDADNCAVCQFIFGPSGCTLPPIPPSGQWIPDVQFIQARCDSTPKTYALPFDLIARPPPGPSC